MGTFDKWHKWNVLNNLASLNSESIKETMSDIDKIEYEIWHGETIDTKKLQKKIDQVIEELQEYKKDLEEWEKK